MADEFTGDSSIFPALLKLKDCLCSELAASHLDQQCECLLMHGLGAAPALPQAGRGVAWVGVTSIFGSKTFPTPDEGGTGCDAPIAASVIVGVIRCYAIKVAGESPADMQKWLDRQMADMAAMRRAILCCARGSVFDVALGVYTPIGPEGGIYGGSWSLTVGAE